MRWEQRRINARCGEGRAVISDAVGKISGSVRGIEPGSSSCVFVGPTSMMFVMSSGTFAGVTLSTIVKEGNKMIDVGSV